MKNVSSLEDNRKKMKQIVDIRARNYIPKSNNRNKKTTKNIRVSKNNKINSINDKSNSRIKNYSQNNDYYSILNKSNTNETDLAIKQIESQIKQKQLIDKRNNELNKLEKKVLQKLYGDLFIRIPNTFKENHLTFENFVFEFGSEIHELYEFDKSNPSYDNLINDVNKLILQKYPMTPDLVKFTPLELKKYFYDLNINDDWSLISKYQSEMGKVEEKRKLLKVAQSMRDYYNDLTDQIENKKKLEKILSDEKNKEIVRRQQNIEKQKLINQKKIEQLQKNEKMLEMLDQEKMKQINENVKIKQNYLKSLEEENNNMNEENIDLIKYKLDHLMSIQTKQMQNYNEKNNYQPKVVLNTGYNLSDDQISAMVDKIMRKKREENVYNFLNEEEKNNKRENIGGNINDVMGNVQKDEVNNIEGINLDIENKVNKILAKKMKMMAGGKI